MINNNNASGVKALAIRKKELKWEARGWPMVTNSVFGSCLAHSAYRVAALRKSTIPQQMRIKQFDNL